LIVAVVFVVLTYLAGNARAAGYLQIPYVAGAGELSVFCSAMIGAGLGFLWFNCHPAQVSWATPARLPWGVSGDHGRVDPPASRAGDCRRGFCDGSRVSNHSDRLVYRYTKRRYGAGRRVFLMAPIHHHFEKKGWYESQVVIRFYILCVICAVVALSTLKIR